MPVIQPAYNAAGKELRGIMFRSAKKRLVALSLLCFVLVSCSAIDSSATKPPISFDPAYLNQQISLIVVKELSAFRTNQDVALHLEYNTENEIVFPSNYNLRIFVQQGGQWVEVKEKPTIRPSGEVVLSPKIPSSYGQIVAFRPQLADLTKTYYMRVCVFGEMTSPEGKKREVAAFANFVLTP